MKITEAGQRHDLAAVLHELVRSIQRGDNEVEYSLTGEDGVKTLHLVISPPQEFEEVELLEQKATVVQPVAAPKPKAPAPTPPPKPKAATPAVAAVAAKPAAVTPAAPEAKTGS